MQLDDMGQTAQIVGWLEAIEIKLEKGKKLTQDERGQFRLAIAVMRAMRDDRQAIAQEFASAREQMKENEANARVEAAKLAREAVVNAKKCERVRLPDDRKSVTRKFNVRTGDDSLKIYATVGHYPDGRPGELFLKCDKQGSLLSGAFDAVALTMSIGLQYGIPLDVFVSKFVGMRFEPAGFTGDKKYPMCTSVLDLVARWLKDVSA